MNVARILSLAALAILVTGCRDWYKTPISPREGALAGGARQVRVTLTGGTRLVLKDPVARADTIFGSLRMGPGEPVRIGVPITEIKSVDVMKFSFFGTAALVLGLATVAAGFLALAVALPET